MAEQLFDNFPVLDSHELHEKLILARTESWTDLSIVASSQSYLLKMPGWREHQESLGYRFTSGRMFIIEERFDLSLLQTLYSLEQLIVTGFNFDDQLCRAISELKLLTHLNIARNKCSETGAVEIAGLDILTSLNLDSNRLRDKGAAEIARLHGLTSLYLGTNFIRDEGAEAIARLDKLTLLDLNFNRVSDRGACAIAKLENLTSLDLNHNLVSDQGAKAITKLDKLTSLRLRVNQVSDKGLKSIAKLNRLSMLDLYGNRIGDIGAAKITTLSNLVALDLGSNQISDKGLAVLLQRRLTDGLCRMTYLNITGNPNILRVDKSVLGSYSPALIADAYLNGVPVLEVRVMFVGMARVGKSYLAKRCFENELSNATAVNAETFAFSLIPQEMIQKDCVPRVTPPGRVKPISINPHVWDFAGQIFTHGVHESFLADDQRTIYLLVLSAGRTPERKIVDWEDKGNGFVYWLKTVTSYGGRDAPIVVAITQCDKWKTNRKVDRSIVLSLTRRSEATATTNDASVTSIQQLKPDAFVISPDALNYVDHHLRDNRRADHLRMLNQAFGCNVTAIVDHCSSCAEDIQGEPPDDISIMPLRRAIEEALKSRSTIWESKFPSRYSVLRDKVQSHLTDRPYSSKAEYMHWCEELDFKNDVRLGLLRILNSTGIVTCFRLNDEQESEFGQSRDESLANLGVGLQWLTRTWPDRVLGEKLINSHWLKQIAYTLVGKSQGKKEFTYEEILDEIRAAHRLILNQDREPTLEEASVAIEFLKWTELCFETETDQFLFPRGFTSRPPDFIEILQVVTLRWDFVPEAAFHRFVVRLLNLKLISERDDGWAIDRFSAGFNIQNATGFVRANPEKGIVEIRYIGDDRSAWKSVFDLVVAVMSGFLGSQPEIEPGRKPWEDSASAASDRPAQARDLHSAAVARQATTFDDTQASSNYAQGSLEDVLRREIVLDPKDEKCVDAIRLYLNSMNVKLHDSETLLLRRLFSDSRKCIPKALTRFYLRVFMFQELLEAVKDSSQKLAAEKVWEWKNLIKWLVQPISSTRSKQVGKAISETVDFENSHVVRLFQYNGLRVNGLSDEEEIKTAANTLQIGCNRAGAKFEPLVNELRAMHRPLLKVDF